MSALSLLDGPTRIVDVTERNDRPVGPGHIQDPVIEHGECRGGLFPLRDELPPLDLRLEVLAEQV
jgi:hypothetical protein